MAERRNETILTKIDADLLEDFLSHPGWSYIYREISAMEQVAMRQAAYAKTEDHAHRRGYLEGIVAVRLRLDAVRKTTTDE